MNLKNKLYIAIGLFLIAISLIFGMLLPNQKSNFELDEYKEQSIQRNSQYQSIFDKHDISDGFENIISSGQESNPTATIEPAPTKGTENSLYERKENPRAIAYITVETDKRTDTYAIMPDVEEETLRNKLGHLPSSAFPGREGLCVIMGHRDTQFSILKYCEIGDSVTIKSNDRYYEYTVFDIKIITSDSMLQFDATEGYKLVLVTCYPFNYSGHAPKKIAIFAELSNIN